jgi:hypothetical protein
MEAEKAIDIIKRMYKGNPTSDQKEALEEAYLALEKQKTISSEVDNTDKSGVYRSGKKELSADEIIAMLAEHNMNFLKFDGDIKLKKAYSLYIDSMSITTKEEQIKEIESLLKEMTLEEQKTFWLMVNAYDKRLGALEHIDVALFKLA